MSGFMDLLEGMLTKEPAKDGKPRTESPARTEAPPPAGWSPAPVQADAPNTYAPPPGWSVPGQPSPLPTAQQADAPQTYVPPQGWTVPGQLQADQQRAQQVAMQQALAHRFQR